jgi:hypothetical protein
MPWNVRWPFARPRPRDDADRLPDVGQPPDDAEPMAEAHLQDIGSGSYELRLEDDEPRAGREADGSQT